MSNRTGKDLRVPSRGRMWCVLRDHSHNWMGLGQGQGDHEQGGGRGYHSHPAWARWWERWTWGVRVRNDQIQVSGGEAQESMMCHLSNDVAVQHQEILVPIWLDVLSCLWERKIDFFYYEIQPLATYLFYPFDHILVIPSRFQWMRTWSCIVVTCPEPEPWNVGSDSTKMTERAYSPEPDILVQILFLFTTGVITPVSLSLASLVVKYSGDDSMSCWKDWMRDFGKVFGTGSGTWTVSSRQCKSVGTGSVWAFTLHLPIKQDLMPQGTLQIDQTPWTMNKERPLS